MGKLIYKCGCEFIIDDGTNNIIYCNDPTKDVPSHGVILNIYDVPLDCPKTWDMFAQAHNVGIFQLEKSLGKQWMKKVAPRNIEELSALISIMRPGALKSVSGDPPKSMAQRYVDRKYGKERIDDFGVPILKNIMEDSFSVLIYQEHAIRIAQEIAGFNEQEADILRKAIGKKNVEEMTKLENSFVEGCAKTGIVNSNKAKEVFSWIRESQKYSFNKSHGTQYAINSYWSAYCKAHFPLQFYCAYLRFAKNKQDRFEEIYNIINEAKLLNINVCLPDIRDMEETFYIKNSDIYFGLTDIKNIGSANLQKAINTIWGSFYDRSFSDITWEDILIYCDNIPITVLESLISSGALDFFNVSRSTMLFQLNITHDKITKKEREWIKQHYSGEGLIEILRKCAKTKREGGGCSNKKRIDILNSIANSIENPPRSLNDGVEYIAWLEKEYLGASISCHVVDGNKESVKASHICRDIINGNNQFMIIAAQIDRINVITTKNNKKMAFLTISDSSCAVDDVVCFPDVFEKVQNILFDNNIVLLYGSVGKRGNFICSNITQI